MRFVCVLGLIIACGGPDETPDADDARVCASDADCDDGVFCNGIERCDGICVTEPACRETESCDEDGARCFTPCAVPEDADGDGARAIECGGNDCDDTNPDRFPGAIEVCDVADVDEDCDPTTFGVRDLDGDGLADSACCNTDGETLNCGVDCDDTSASVSPRAPEVCNGFDDDCDGDVDEGVLSEFFVDEDGDGFGARDAEAVIECRQRMGFSPTRTDCDDSNGAINPGAVEVCDGETDEDCSGEVDDIEGGCDCDVGDERDCGLLGRCEGALQSCEAGRWGVCTIGPRAESCNEIDDDCDGTVDEGQTVRCFLDADNDGLAAFGAAPSDQCPDETRAAAPFLRCPLFFTGTEAPSVDQGDCDDSRALEMRPDTCHPDRDGDGFGRGAPTYKCPGDPCPGDLVDNNDDCCPGDSSGFPGSTAWNSDCPSSDSNCDGEIERRYGHYTCSRILGTCTGGTRRSSPYLRQDVGCGVVSTQVDQCMEVSGSCRVSWSEFSGSGSDIRVQQCR